MNILNKMERKFGKYAIHNLMKYIVALYGIGVVIGSVLPYEFLALNFNLIRQGQVWRLITYLIPITTLRGILFTLISVYVYYIFGTALEYYWGAFRFNLYIFSGVLFNLLSSLILYLITGFTLSPSLDVVCSTLFLAYAVINPNEKILLYFIIPIKVKYLAWFRIAFYIYDIMNYIIYRQYLLIIPVVVSIGNFLIFFFATRNYRRISPSEIKRKAVFRQQMNSGRKQGNVTQFRGRNTITRHKCAICGRTELDDEQLEFRFCSKCDGNYEYCMDHLFTHEHVKR
ncbi:hypothetical protein H0486_12465 [Lachnospiraceae bacterium MD1]|jgi:hypothetical protein|uniref:Rhomboid family intramembrane serine protease n=1 Tax=Variimorphobacter saccharofermentans TaxID=2755051 RepID=A0A839K2T1_9FIRM|nr:rhomboid family intramembrane serine protease [Variimorphobacter saccharofermentans]MBB2183688.1 hypothetical protein [Variimorphobacter saccharofermentans]